jgi:hypothetical protein
VVEVVEADRDDLRRPQGRQEAGAGRCRDGVLGERGEGAAVERDQLAHILRAGVQQQQLAVALHRGPALAVRRHRAEPHSADLGVHAEAANGLANPVDECRLRETGHALLER